jgi:hypothetical protein
LVIGNWGILYFFFFFFFFVLLTPIPNDQIRS